MASHTRLTQLETCTCAISTMMWQRQRGIEKQGRLSGTSAWRIARTSLLNFHSWRKHNRISCRHSYWCSREICMWVVMKNRRTRKIKTLKTINEKILNWKMTNNNYLYVVEWNPCSCKKYLQMCIRHGTNLIRYTAFWRSSNINARKNC